jgi:RimJ/RimL family protein N-acetyltransferase
MTLRPPDPPLSDGVVTLRAWGEDGDVEAITAACNDPAIAAFLDQIPSPYTADDAREYIAACRVGWDDGTMTNLAVTVDGRAVGSIGVRWYEPEQGNAEVGYWIAPDARGQGLCTRALHLVARWVFEQPWMERLQLRADEDNAPSNRVALKGGFQREGVLRSSRYNARLDRRVNFVLYSLLRREIR